MEDWGMGGEERKGKERKRGMEESNSLIFTWIDTTALCSTFNSRQH